jgi:nucleotide-binding universal stress UspA family protein
MPAELIYIKPTEEESSSLPAALYLKEWVKLNCPDLQYHVLTGSPAREIENFLTVKSENCLLILGAYSRSSLSRLMHVSMADKVVQMINMPLFISHK